MYTTVELEWGDLVEDLGLQMQEVLYNDGSIISSAHDLVCDIIGIAPKDYTATMEEDDTSPRATQLANSYYQTLNLVLLAAAGSAFQLRKAK